MKYIIDTDIGDAIDDAFALLFSMELGLDIIGITTVFENTDERARIVKKLLKLYGKGYKNTPVFAGYGKISTSAELCQYTADLDDEIYAPDSKESEDAVDFIISSAEKHGDDLSIIAIGPFTNIAKAIEKSPSAMKNVGKVIIMGGAYFKQYADWNVTCDPESAKIMFDNIDNIRCIGADVTHKTIISREDDKIISQYRGNQAKEYASLLYRLWKEATGEELAVLHDPLAVYYAVYEEICKFEKSPIAVITEGAARGITLNVDAYSKSYFNDFYKNNTIKTKHFLAKEVDSKRITEEFIKIFK